MCPLCVCMSVDMHYFEKDTTTILYARDFTTMIESDPRFAIVGNTNCNFRV